MRESIILNELRDADDYISLDYLSKKLEVSTRTIRNDMKNISEDRTYNGFTLKYKSKLGYILEIEDYVLFENYMNKLFPAPLETPEQRLEAILVILLFSDSYITINELSKEFLVSQSLIKSDLKKLNFKLSDIHLILERKAHYGIRITGDIKFKQQMLSDFFMKDNRKLMEFYTLYECDKLKERINNIIDILSKYRMEINLVEFKELTIQLVLIYIKSNLRKSKDRGKTILEQKLDNSATSEIIKLVFGDQEIYIKEEEFYFLKSYIRQKTINEVFNIRSSDKDNLNEIIKYFFREVDNEYGTSFLADKEFFKLLYLHLISLIERARGKQELKNSFVHKISKQYPTVFNLAIQLAKLIEKFYDIKISQDEIGFIATHIAVPFEKNQEQSFSNKYKIAIISSSGVGCAYLIKIKLSEIFQNADLRNFSMLDKEKVIEFSPDLIFSISELPFEVNVPVILIKEILDELDYLKIKEKVRFVDNFGTLSTPQRYFLDLFDKKHFICVDENKEYKDILNEMAIKVVEDGANVASYPKDVWERESFLNTIYTNGVTIPHPIEMNGNRNLISVALIKNNIEYENKKPKLIFMISLEKGNLELHEEIIKNLNNIMIDENIVNDLRSSNSYEEFIHKLKKRVGR